MGIPTLFPRNHCLATQGGRRCCCARCHCAGQSRHNHDLDRVEVATGSLTLLGVVVAERSSYQCADVIVYPPNHEFFCEKLIQFCSSISMESYATNEKESIGDFFMILAIFLWDHQNFGYSQPCSDVFQNSACENCFY